MTHFPQGSYRRRLRMVISDHATDGSGVVDGGLEDDFHYFTVRIVHDRSCVRKVTAHAIRWPWTTCPAAADALHALEGMELSPDCLAVGSVADPKQHCTHMFDLAGLAIAHAARGGAAGTTRQYDVEIPHQAQAGGEVVVHLARDGVLLLAWTLDGRRVVAPPTYADAPWRRGFFRWAEETFDADTAEAAIVLRRACDIGMGRGMDLDAVERALELEQVMSGVCFTMQPEQIQVALRHKETIRDFDLDPDAALAEGPHLPAG